MNAPASFLEFRELRIQEKTTGVRALECLCRSWRHQFTFNNWKVIVEYHGGH